MATLPLGLIVDPNNNSLLVALRKLENYNLDHITRDVEKKYHWTQDKAHEIETETRRFFALAFLDQGYYHIPEADVDEYWHRMILNTQFYHSFCRDIFGDYYHHTPEPNANTINANNRNRTQQLVNYWFGTTWHSLVLTCTQCRGPYLVNLPSPDPLTLPHI